MDASITSKIRHLIMRHQLSRLARTLMSAFSPVNLTDHYYTLFVFGQLSFSLILPDNRAVDVVQLTGWQTGSFNSLFFAST